MAIGYATQVLVCEKFTVDVLLHDSKIVIQWDGGYWHGFGGAKDDRQRKRQNLDRSQDAYMTKAGYTVLRFWEHEVHKQPDDVSKRIAASILGTGIITQPDWD